MCSSDLLKDVIQNNSAISGTSSNNDVSSEPQKNEETVYWVAGGEVYHSTSNCSTLKRSSNIQSGTIAQSGKSRPCKVCY